MPDVKNKAKKMDVRVSSAIYEEVELVAWGSEKKRSELLRIMIADFMQQGTLEINGQKMNWANCVSFAKAKLFEQDLSLDDLQRLRARRSVDMPGNVQDGLKEDLEWFAELYAQNALQALKKHVGE